MDAILFFYHVMSKIFSTKKQIPDYVIRPSSDTTAVT